MPGERSAPRSNRAGESLRRVVDLASHKTGSVVALMDGARVTLRQVLLISRVDRLGSASLSDLTTDSSVSMAALSQMVDRLVRQGWLTRREDSIDRRRKAIQITPRAYALLRRLERARSADYQLGLSPLSPELRARLAATLDEVVAAIEGASKNPRSIRQATPDTGVPL